MLKSIQVKNFKTLRDVTIPLSPRITVMVGANNSGKSNALAVLQFLGEFGRRRSYSQALAPLGGQRAIQPRLQADGFPPTLAVTTASDPEILISPRTSANSPILETLRRISVFDLSISALRAASLVQRGASLSPDGRNAAATLDAMAGEQPSLRDRIEEEVKAAAPDVNKLLTQPGIEPGTKILGVEEKSGAVFGANDMSDGLLLLIGLSIAAQTTASQDGLIAIEEPERGIHPRRIREVLDQLLKVAERGTQVVLTTHSPLLLDEFKDYPESVLIFDRDETGTHVTRLSDKPEWMEGLNEGPLGDIWYSGILGGVPKK